MFCSDISIWWCLEWFSFTGHLRVLHTCEMCARTYQQWYTQTRRQIFSSPPFLLFIYLFSSNIADLKYCWQYWWHHCWQHCQQYCWFSNIAVNIVSNIADYSAILLTIQKYCWQYCQQYCKQYWTRSYLWGRVCAVSLRSRLVWLAADIALCRTALAILGLLKIRDKYQQYDKNCMKHNFIPEPTI